EAPYWFERTANKEDVEKYGYKEGEKYQIRILPDEPVKLWEWFVTVPAYSVFLMFVKQFQIRYPEPTVMVIRGKLDKMHEFINKAIKEDGERSSFDNVSELNTNYQKSVYVSLINGYYKHNPVS